MLDPVIIEFTTAGVPAVNRAFATIGQSIERLEKNSARAATDGTKARVRGAQTEAKERERAAAKIAKEGERLERQQTRIVEKEQQRRAAIVRKSSSMAGQYANQQAKADARLESQKTRTVEREAERRMRIQMRSSEMAGRHAAKQAAQELRLRERTVSTWGQRGSSVARVATSSVSRIVGGLASIAGATMGIGGGMLLADAARGEMSAHKSAQLLVNSVTSGGTAAPGQNVDAVLGRASQVARAEGMDKTSVVNAALAYSRSAKGGDFEGAMGNMGFFAKVANVTGANMDDLATSAGMLQSQNPALGGKNNGKMQQLLLDVVAQSHMGSLSVPEVAKMAGVIGSGRGAFGGDQGDNQRKLLGLAQLVAPETDPLEAGTMIKDFATEGQKHAKHLRKLGVKYDAQGRMGSVEQTIDAVLKGTGGNQGKIMEAFGSDRGSKIFAHLAPIYNNAGGGASGLEAVHKELASVTAATQSPEDLDKRDVETLSDPAKKLEMAFNRIKDVIGTSLEPRLNSFANDTLPKLIPMFEAVIDEVGKFAGWFADNPIKGVGAIVLAAVTKDLASAGISAAAEAGVAAIMKKIAGMVGGGSVPNAPSVPGAAGGALGKFGAAAAGLTVGVAVGEALAPVLLDPMFASMAKGQGDALARTNVATNAAAELRAKARGGKVTAADIDAARKMAGSLQGQEGDQKQDAASLHSRAGVPLFGPSQSTLGAADGALKNTSMALSSLNAAIEAATKSLKSMGATASNTAPGNPANHVPMGAR